MHIVPGLHLIEDMVKAKTMWTLSGHRLTFSNQVKELLNWSPGLLFSCRTDQSLGTSFPRCAFLMRKLFFSNQRACNHLHGFSFSLLTENNEVLRDGDVTDFLGYNLLIRAKIFFFWHLSYIFMSEVKNSHFSAPWFLPSTWNVHTGMVWNCLHFFSLEKQSSFWVLRWMWHRGTHLNTSAGSVVNQAVKYRLSW